jgi:hypothetical protein
MTPPPPREALGCAQFDRRPLAPAARERILPSDRRVGEIGGAAYEDFSQGARRERARRSSPSGDFLARRAGRGSNHAVADAHRDANPGTIADADANHPRA